MITAGIPGWFGGLHRIRDPVIRDAVVV